MRGGGGGGNSGPAMSRNPWEPWDAIELDQLVRNQCQATSGNRPPKVTICQGMPRETTKGHGRSREATGGHGRPRNTMGHHGTAWETIIFYTESSDHAVSEFHFGGPHIDQSLCGRPCVMYCMLQVTQCNNLWMLASLRKSYQRIRD